MRLPPPALLAGRGGGLIRLILLTHGLTRVDFYGLSKYNIKLRNYKLFMEENQKMTKAVALLSGGTRPVFACVINVRGKRTR